MKNLHNLPDQAEIHRILDYNPGTGEFHWKRRSDVPIEWNTRWAGKKTGAISKGHYVVRINYVLYQAHDIAWCYMTGAWPKEEIDHKNQNGFDNKFLNLRPANRSQNNCNRGAQKNNKSGYKGVYWDKNNNKWFAQICIRQKRYFLGRFAKIIDAQHAYRIAAELYHGEFARMA